MEISQLMIFWSKCLVACFLVFGMFYVASGIVDRFLGKDVLSAKWSAIIVVGLWAATMGFHLFAAAGFFRVWVVVAAVAFLIGIVRLSGYTFRIFMIATRHDGVVFKNFLLLETNPLQKCFLIILGIAALLVAGRGSILPPLGLDALTYHAVKAGMWVQSGDIQLMEAPGGWFLYRMYPGGGEALQALGMLPFYSDFLLCLVDFVEWLSLIPALFLLGRCSGLDRKSSFIGGLFCLFLPCVVFSVGSCYVDLFSALSLMLGLAFTAKFCLSHRLQYLVLGLMALGIAGGVKFLAYAPIFGILLVVVLHIVLCRQLSIQTLLVFGLAIILMLAPLVPWLFYNVPTNGYSFFPISLDVAGLKLSPNNPAINWVLDRPEIIPYDFRYEAAAFRRLFRWPWYNEYGWTIPNFGILSLLPFCIFPMAMISITRRQVWVGLLIIGVVGSIIGCYFSPAFTVIRQGWPNSNSRFLFAAFFPIVVISILFFKGSLRERYLDLLLVGSVLHFVIGVRLEWQQFEIPYLVLASVIGVLVTWAVFASRRRLTIAQHVLGVIVVLLISGSGLYLARNYIRAEAIEKSYFFHSFPGYWVDSVKCVDTPPLQRRIAITSGPLQTVDNLFMYLFLGGLLQNTIHHVPITESGKSQHFGPWVVEWEQFSYASWLNRLHQRGITHVMSFRPSSVEISWMLQHPESFEQVTGDNTFGLFWVRRFAEFK